MAWFRSIGDKTGQQFHLTSRASREIKARARTIEKYLESIEKKSYDLAKAFKNQHNTKTTSPSSEKHYLDQVLTYLQGGLRLDQLPTILQGSSRNLKGELIKIKKTFGTLSVRAGIDNNPNPTYADKIAGAKMKNKKTKKKVI